jgi:16S rRNA (adenine1518-N6/adenine1519-N6)-dimethyltransferase
MVVGKQHITTGRITITGNFMNDSPIGKKSLGQHWLRDDYSLESIVEAADIKPEDTVLEIGPGLGTLTEKLVKRSSRVVAVELDAPLASQLLRRVPVDNLTVTTQDILAYDLTQLPSGYKVVANIPYYLTSKLLRQLCESSNPFSKAALLVQKEVAERVCAGPGSGSILTISVQFYAKASLGPIVPAHLFSPPPKVDSQILQLEFRQEPLFPDVDTKGFFRIVKAGFSQRRKTLLNSLSGGLQIGKPQAADLLSRAEIDPTMRAQTLSLDQWYNLYLLAETDQII